jgi:serine protease
MDIADPGLRARHVRHVLMRRAALESGLALERTESAASNAAVHPDDVLARLDAIVQRMPADEVGDPSEFRKAFTTLLEHGDPALRKLLDGASGGMPALTGDEVASLEAIIVADGSRPSFLLREGTYAPDHPFLGSWHKQMKEFEAQLPHFASCIGRIQVPEGSASVYNGTGTLVPALDGAEHLVLTNFHVVQHAREMSKVKMEPAGGNKLAVKGDWVIDFIGESGSEARNRWRVKEVRLPDGADANFAGLDAAVLRIEPFGSESKLPPPAITLSSNPDYARGEGSASLVTIGFPGEPNTLAPGGAQVDWNFVIKKLFNNRFGLKRVAPGKFGERAGSVAGDKLGHILSHDATTFGGASGSLIFAWREDEPQPAFALHFAGTTAVANYAVSLSKAAEALRVTGLRID